MATGPCQQSVQRLDERTGWIAQELMGMKKALESERRAMASGCVVASEYWQTPFGEGNEQGSWRTTSRQSGFEQRPRAGSLVKYLNKLGFTQVMIVKVDRVFAGPTVMENFKVIGPVSINP